MRVVIESYVPGGAHHLWNPKTGHFQDGFRHRDWRYRIMPVDSTVIVYRRSGFCTWAAAAASLEKAWPKVVDQIKREWVD